MWLETITVRTPSLERLDALLPELLEQLAASAPGIEIDVYTRFPTSSDLSLHLMHRFEPIQHSANGLRLAAALGNYGTVDHALWQPCSNSSQGGAIPE